MNQKLKKITDEIEKTKAKISDMQSRAKDLERQKTEIENADIIAMIRGIDVPPDEFGEFVRLFKEQQKNKAVPDMDTDYENKEEDVTVEN